MSCGNCKMHPPDPVNKKECKAGQGHKFCSSSSPNTGKMQFVANADDCCALCAETPQCVAWVWGRSQNEHGLHSCFMKSEIIKKEEGNCTFQCMLEDGCTIPSIPVVDLWLAPGDKTEGPAHGYNNTCIAGNPNGPKPAQCHAGPKGDKWYDGYEDSLFQQHVLDFIDTQDPSQPMFLFWVRSVVRFADCYVFVIKLLEIKS